MHAKLDSELVNYILTVDFEQRVSLTRHGSQVNLARKLSCEVSE
jgi:hypothetical protein